MGSRVELFEAVRRDRRVEALSIRELAERHKVHGRCTSRWRPLCRRQTYVGGAPAASTYKAPVVAQPAPAAAPVAPGGATALCNDGNYSYAAHHQGACSGHGGVKVFYK